MNGDEVLELVEGVHVERLTIRAAGHGGVVGVWVLWTWLGRDRCPGCGATTPRNGWGCPVMLDGSWGDPLAWDATCGTCTTWWGPRWVALPGDAGVNELTEASELLAFEAAGVER